MDRTFLIKNNIFYIKKTHFEFPNESFSYIKIELF